MTVIHPITEMLLSITNSLQHFRLVIILWREAAYILSYHALLSQSMQNYPASRVASIFPR